MLKGEFFEDTKKKDYLFFLAVFFLEEDFLTVFFFEAAFVFLLAAFFFFITIRRKEVKDNKNYRKHRTKSYSCCKEFEEKKIFFYARNVFQFYLISKNHYEKR